MYQYIHIEKNAVHINLFGEINIFLTNPIRRLLILEKFHMEDDWDLGALQSIQLYVQRLAPSF